MDLKFNWKIEVIAMRKLTITEQEAVNGRWNFWTWIGKAASATAVIASYEGYDDVALKMGLMGILF